MCLESLAAEFENHYNDEQKSDIMYCSPSDEGSCTDALALVSPSMARSKLRQLQTFSGG